MHLIIIPGALRLGSFNRKLALEAASLLPAGVTSEICDLRPIPMYDGDVEAAGLPEPVVALREKIRAADEVIISMPEYNFSIAGPLKNAIDWISRPPNQPFDRKPVAIMGASTGLFGTIRGQAHLRQSFLFLNSYVMGRPEFLLGQAQNKFDGEGKLTDEKSREQLEKFVAAVVEWVGRMKS